MSRKISVLFILPSLQGGGAERVILTILRHLDRDRFSIALAVIDARDPVLASDLPADIDRIDLHSSRARYSAIALVRLIWKRRPDVVFCVLGHVNLLLALIKPGLPRATKLIARETIVMSAYLSGNNFAWLWKAAYRKFLPRCDVIVCQSRDMQHSLIQDLGIPARNMVVVRNPVDIDRIRALSAATPVNAHVGAAAGAIGLIAAGRLVWQKGFDLLIEALALLDDARFHVSILGQGPLLGDLKRLTERCNLSAQVHFLGFKSNPYALFAAADAFVLSSRFEGMPNVVLEALACGTGVIATPAPGGVDELLANRPRCVLAQAISAESLAEAIKSYDFAARRSPFDLGEFAVGTIVARYAEVLTTAVVQS
jgi:glycosyltransferase involved in cell wall biosynthesis